MYIVWISSTNNLVVNGTYTILYFKITYKYVVTYVVTYVMITLLVSITYL